MPVDLRPGENLIQPNEAYVTALHIFKWGPSSFMTIETGAGQIIKFPSTAFVEGAVYYIKVRRLIECGPNARETQAMGVSSSELP